MELEQLQTSGADHDGNRRLQISKILPKILYVGGLPNVRFRLLLIVQAVHMKPELIARLEDLLSKDALEIATEVRALQKDYQKIWTSEFEKAKQAFIDEGGHARDFHFQKTEEDLRFETLLEKYGKLKKEAEAKLSATQARNLSIRMEIIAKIRDLSQVSENVGAAVRKLQELQAQWKECGQVSPHKYKEVQAEYSRAVEEFYYNLKIFRDLHEHDLKKNFELKTQVIEKLRHVQELENIKEAERLIKVYRNEWDEIGPVPNGKWENLKQEYKTVLDDTYKKIKAYYHGLEEQKEQNLKTKEQLIVRAQEVLESVKEESKAQKWNEATDKLLAIQAEWKNTGRAIEKENERVWSEFRAVCDAFFEKKKEFFSVLSEKSAASRKAKSELIAKAEAIQNSTDWQKTATELIRLQENWKKIPNHGDKEESRLFNRFRKACNHFFDARKKHFEQIDASYEQNLSKKEEIINKLNSFTLSEDMAENRERLKAISSEFTAAGHVPAKDKKRINDAFYNRLDELYEQMHIDRHEKQMMQFRARVERLSASENAGDLLRKEADHLRRLSEEISGRIRTYENNLGFFKTSKGNEGFLKEVSDKVNNEKAKLDEVNAKRKLVSEAMNKFRENEKARAEA